jgi:autotransporter-associated beta strand protein
VTNPLTIGGVLDTGNSTLDLNGLGVSAGMLASSGTVTNSSATTVTLTVTPSGTDTFAGRLQDGAANKKLALTVGGAGSLTLSGTNAYTGPTTATIRHLHDPRSLASDPWIDFAWPRAASTA